MKAVKMIDEMNLISDFDFHYFIIFVYQTLGSLKTRATLQ